jgi:hypothetical protein
MPASRLLGSILDDDDGDDPILSVVNIVDVFLVIIAVLLIAVIENPLNPFTTQNAIVIKDPGQPGMEMLVKKGNELKRYKNSGQIGEGEGREHGLCARDAESAAVSLIPTTRLTPVAGACCRWAWRPD